ncbi:MAG: Gfo/Idh/MocA family oxidoreductase [Clostridia bacterium]|nr:Gfo/Idh/MocA family oxidoreductase [Clostridia bacterium]
MNEVKVALIGYGGIAGSHKRGYDLLAKQNAPVRLVAVCDIRPETFKGATKINLGGTGGSLDDIATYTDFEKMLAEVDFDMADICVPTYLHKKITVRMLRAGKHVLCEKPMALSSAECDEMITVAAEQGKRLMIGQCLRFEPTYLYLKRCIEDGRFGKLKNLSMERLSIMPRWGFENWFFDHEKSGGVALDLHIHDIDMARFLLGEPTGVSAVTMDISTKQSFCNTRLFYPETTVFATGSWDESVTTPFSMGYRARFEKASVIMNMSGTTVYPDEVGAKPYAPEFPELAEERGNRMAEEIRYIASLILDPDKNNEHNPPESALRSVALVELLRKSAAQDGEIIKL